MIYKRDHPDPALDSLYDRDRRSHGLTSRGAQLN